MTDHPSSSVPTRPPRWRSGLVIFSLGLIAFLYLTFAPGLEGQPRVLLRALVVIVTTVLLLLWLTFFSRLPWRRRLGTWSVLLLLVALGAALFRFEGFTGNVAPILVPRWQSTDAMISTDAASRADVGDYPQFLGPTRSAVVEGVALARDWDAKPPQLVWRRPVGEGWSAFAVSGELAVTQEQHGDEERVVAYDLRTGEVLWSHADPGRYSSPLAGDGPRATPTIAEGTVYTFGALGRLNALDLETGQLLWSRNAFEENDGKLPDWGSAGSPLVLDRVVVVNVGGPGGRSLVAYDRETGERAWSGGDAPTGYASPALMTLAGAPMIVMLNADSVVAHSPEDGRVLWQYPWPKGQPNVAQPVAIGASRVLVSSGYGVGSELLEIGGDAESGFAVTSLWQSPRLKAKFTNVVVHDGRIYGLDDGVLVCLEPETGERCWKRGRYGHGQVILVEDLLLVQTEEGEMVLVEPNPEEPRELGRFDVLPTKAWNSPALAGSLLLVRNHEEAAVYELPLAG